ncbi:Dicer-like protein 2, partial [Datura stramonium]|nr:Dicer-like protein 2 [Datura stramonium]
KAGLHKHILHASQDLQKQIFNAVEGFEKLDLVSRGWEADYFPKGARRCSLSPLLVRSLLIH